MMMTMMMMMMMVIMMMVIRMMVVEDDNEKHLLQAGKEDGVRHIGEASLHHHDWTGELGAGDTGTGDGNGDGDDGGADGVDHNVNDDDSVIWWQTVPLDELLVM